MIPAASFEFYGSKPSLTNTLNASYAAFFLKGDAVPPVVIWLAGDGDEKALSRALAGVVERLALM